MSKIVLARRVDAGIGLNIVSLAGGVAAGLLIGVVILLMNGLSLSDVVQEFFVSTFLRSEGLSLVTVAVTPLILCGLAAAVALMVRFWNIGIEGQMWAGAVGATAVALYHLGPEPMRLVTMGLAAAAAGAAWIIIPLVLSVTLKINEIITTLLLNYVALLFTKQLLFGPWRDPAANFPFTQAFEPGAQLAPIGWGRVSWGIGIALCIWAAVTYVRRVTRFGLEIEAVGSAPEVARAAGLAVLRTTSLVVLASGALAGLAGFLLVSGQEHRLTQSLCLGYGFSGIVIAFLARLSTAGTLLSAVLVAVLYTAADNLQVFYQLPRALVDVIQALLLLCIICSDIFVRYRVRIVA